MKTNNNGQPVRVLHILYSLGRTSGDAAVVMNLYRNIDREKLQFDFLYLDERPVSFKSEILGMGGRVFYLERPRLLSVVRFIRAAGAFFRERASDYAAVHSHEALVSAVCFFYAGRYGVRHRIAHSHNTRYSDKKLNAVRNYFLCLPLKRYANVYFACSREAGAFLFGKKDAESGKVHILRNAVDCDSLQYDPATRSRVREELKIGARFAVGHVGRFSAQKNHELLLEIFSELRKTERDSVLMLAGGGDLEAKVKDRARELGLGDNVLFLGRTSGARDLFQAMDVFVFPSVFEGLGLALIEAQAAGLPCFASTAVPPETRVTDLVSYIALDKPAAYWAGEILKCRGHERRNAACAVRKSGYDIKDVALELERYYLGLSDRA